VVAAFHDTPPSWPWIIHAAEGVDEEAGGEVPRLERLGCLAANTVFVHGVGLAAGTAARAVAAGASLVWCPTSNEFLFGRTADVRAFDDAGRLAIGSDSRLSGAGDLLDEMRAAATTRQTCSAGVCRAVMVGAAEVLRLPDAGRLRPGWPADLAVFRGLRPDPGDAIVEATRRDVLMTMVGGRPSIAVPALARVFEATGARAVQARVDGEPRLLDGWIGRRTTGLGVSEPGLEVLT
jgi:cytosine/adenosine deaminase-related metal-dependent hydrolase